MQTARHGSSVVRQPASTKKHSAPPELVPRKSRLAGATCLRFDLTHEGLARIVLSSSPQTTISSHIRPTLRHYWHDLAYPHHTDNRDLCCI